MRAHSSSNHPAGQTLIPTRQNVGIPDNPPRYPFPYHIGLSIVLRPYLRARRVLTPVDAMFYQLFRRTLPRPTCWHLLLRILKRLKRCPREILTSLQHYGAVAEKRDGRSRAAQLRDLIKLHLFTEESAVGYYEGQMARHHGNKELFAYLPYFEYLQVVIQLQRDLFGAPPFFLNSKVSFGQWARQNGITTPPEFVVGLQHPSDIASKLAVLGDEIVIKPSMLMMGTDVQVWQQTSQNLWVRNEQALNTPELMQRLHHLVRQKSSEIIVQKRLKNHPSLVAICGHTLSTSRIVTMINEEGTPEIVEHRWRMTSDSETVTDNGGTGGVFWDIDNFDTGHISRGSRNGQELDLAPLTKHPIHGRKMVGAHHPFAKELTAFALSNHRKMTNVLLVGWDIAMTPDGPAAIEVNFPTSAIASFQIAYNGFENVRYGQILAHHAQRWLSLMAPTTPVI